MKDLVGSALLVSGDLTSGGRLWTAVLEEESDATEIFHLHQVVEDLT